MQKAIELEIPTAEAMIDLGRQLGDLLGRGMIEGSVVLLHGDLGAGKTTLVQGIAQGLGVIGAVQSPTFTVVGEHEGKRADGSAIRLYHLDLYRLDDPDELESLGYDQYIQPDDGVSVIEWPERAGDWLPDAFLLVRIDYRSQGGRHVTLTAMPPDRWSIVM